MGKLLLALQYLPHVLAAVTAVEQIAIAGGAKKQIIMNSISAVAGIGQQTGNKDVVLISQLVDATVQNLNASGIFKKAPVVANLEQSVVTNLRS